MFTGKTAVYGIIGQPVTHSLSPVFQNYFLKQRKRDAVYVPFPLQSDTLMQGLDGLRMAGVQGLNVTVPFKEEVLPLVQCSEDVQIMGAANTLKADGDVWQAYNTDWQGVQAVLEGMDLELQGASLLLFGAGGTSRAVLHAVAALGVTKVWVCNRSSERRDALLQHARQAYPDLHCEALAWEQQAVSLACAESVMVVNTTTIGLSGQGDFPFVLSDTGGAMDAVYHPSGVTAFTRAAQQAGRRTVDGLPMLVAQGAASFRLWHAGDEVNIQDALRYTEKQLHRTPVCLPAWE